MASQEAVQLNNSLNRLRSFDKTSLIAREEWGELNFKGAEESFEKIFGILSQLQSLSTHVLPENILKQINLVLHNIEDNFKLINSFNIKQPNAVADQIALQNKINGNANSLFEKTYLQIPYLMVEKNNFISMLKKSNSEITSLLNDSKEKIKKVNESSDEINQIITSAREIAQEAGVGHFTEEFANEAKTCVSKSTRWLWATIILAFFTLLFAWCFIFIFDNHDDSKYFQFATSKIAFILILLSASIWCGKIYKSWMHLSHINKHKANALKTFLAFSKATDDPQTKNAVLMEAAHCIFSTSNTGLIVGQEPFEQTKFFEIFKGIEK